MHVTMWIPNTGMVDHTGNPIAESDDFFVPPPPEIGNIITANTTLKQFAEPSAVTSRRIRGTLVTGVVIFVFAWLLSLADWKPDAIPVFREVTASIICIAMLIAWLVQKPRYTCSYVGTHGFARFACYGSRSRITLNDIFRFETATSLKSSLRNIYVNGAYLNTEYNFRWFDFTGKQCYRLAGVYRGRNTSGPDDRYLVAQSAEMRWTEYLLPTALSSIEKGNTWRFNTSRGHYIEVGPEYIEFKDKKINHEGLMLCVEHGFIVFCRQNEKRVWYKLDRAPRIRYAQIENALLLIYIVEHLTGREVASFQVASDARYHLLHGIPS